MNKFFWNRKIVEVFGVKKFKSLKCWIVKLDNLFKSLDRTLFS